MRCRLSSSPKVLNVINGLPVTPGGSWASLPHRRLKLLLSLFKQGPAVADAFKFLSVGEPPVVRRVVLDWTL